MTDQNINAANLNTALSERSVRGLRITADFEPLAGPNTPIKTAVYAQGKDQAPAIYDGYDPATGEPATVAVILSDEASRNIAEQQLLNVFPTLRSFVIDAPDAGNEPMDRAMQAAHRVLPIDVLQLPHSIASTHLALTDIDQDGERIPFIGSAAHEQLRGCGPHNAEWLYENFPGFVISGFWFSINGKHTYPPQHTNSKVIASCAFPITAVGAKPMSQRGGMLDPLIQTASSIGAATVKQVAAAAGLSKTASKPSVSKPSEIAMGSVPPSTGVAGIPWVTASRIVGAGSVKFDAIRRLQFPNWTDTQIDAARTTLVALSIAAIIAAADQPDIRSGTDLARTRLTIETIGASSDFLVFGCDDAEALVAAADAAAVNVGLPSVFGADADTAKTSLHANKTLVEMIAADHQNQTTGLDG